MVEPQWCLVVDQRGQRRRCCRIEWCGRGQAFPGLLQASRSCHRIEHGTECSLCLADRVCEAWQSDACTHVRIFRMAKNWTRVAAAFDAVASRLTCCAAASFSTTSVSSRL